MDTQLALLHGVHALRKSAQHGMGAPELSVALLCAGTNCRSDRNKGEPWAEVALEPCFSTLTKQGSKACAAMESLILTMPSVSVASSIARSAALRCVVTMAAMEVGAGAAAVAAAAGARVSGGQRASSRRRALGHCGSLLHQLDLQEHCFAACQLSVRQ
jgi:hypothetical protein